MWGKRPKPGGKGLRCGWPIRRDNNDLCNRPARPYKIHKRDFSAGEFKICKNHLQMYLKDGWTATWIDRRETKA
jgi:hypothetical protein